MKKQDLSSFIQKANESKSIVKAPKQKTIPIKKSKRENEVPYTLWIDKDLLKKYKLLAIQKESNVKELIVESMKNYFIK